ncbi:MAG: DNA-processing protein DprA [Candidatus Peregrinibacteria bacterium]
MKTHQKTLDISSKSYPYLLNHIFNPPKKLYYEGDLSILEKTCLSIVGTRDYSDYGKYMTEKIIEELSPLNITIVSGLAKGIDAIAHKQALKRNLSTVAVLGSGLNKIYPTQNIPLAKQIERKGLLISEYPPDTPPLNFHFPQRNRIISGLSIATIVIESPEKSGTLITARLALEQGRDIFVVTGDADRPNSLGTLRLLQNGGAYPIASGKDIIDALTKQPHLFNPDPAQKTTTIPLNLTPQQQKIFSALSRTRPHSLDTIQSKTSLTTQDLLINLSHLEIQNLIKTKDGKYIRRC